ncbi:MAG: SusC/RagA family TonB-linked outer membrane protein [Ginsengibacter sp.]
MRKLMYLGVSLLVCMFFSSMTMAQTKTISGTVTGSDGKGLEGVTIAVRNTDRVTITNNSGAYSISAAPGETLVFSYVGFETHTMRVGSANSANISLVRGGGNLDEVVVVGYGKQRKSDITGAVSNVDMKTLGSRPIADLGRGLQGTVPGLSVRVPSGEVGSDPLIRIRGFIGSIEGSSAPLILLDNVEIPSIQMINPNDVESITILKDASASSIYGAKAAFGVVLITTKKGSNVEGNSLSYSNNFSWQNPSKKIDIAGVDGLQYTLDAHKNMKSAGPAGGFWRLNDASMEKIREWQEKYGSTVKYNDPVVYGRDWIFDGSDKYGYRIYDPVKTMVKENAFTQNHNISLNGRSKNTTYNASFGYFGQEGMMKPAVHDDFTRYTAKLSLSTKVTDFVTVRAGALFSDRMKRYPNSTNSGGFSADPWLYLYRWSRLFPTGVLENGEEMRDPYWDTKNSKTAYLGQKYINLNIGTTIDITKNWTVDADYTFDTRSETNKSSLGAITARETWYTPTPWKDEQGNLIYVDSSGNKVTTGGIPGYQFPLSNYVSKEASYIYESSFRAQMHTVNAYTTYRLNLAEKNKFKFMLGTNIVANDYESHFSRLSELINNDNPQFDFAIGKQEAGGDANWDSQLGFFGRMNYAFDNKYLVEGNLRYDGTSKFPFFLQRNWYPSASAGWIITKEKFMSGVTDVLSFAKLRASYGSIGDQSVLNNLYLSRLASGNKTSWLNSGGVQTFYLGTPNPVSDGIGWQNIATLNLGADMRFFNNKFGIVAEYFERATKDMIINGESLPATYGAGAPKGNYGNLMTKGYEISLDFNHRFKNGLGINVTANLSDALTNITKGPDWNTPYENRLIDNTYTTGKRYGDIYGYVTDRLYQKSDFVYDANGNFVQTTIVWQGTSKKTNQLSGKNPVYQTNFEDGNQILLISPGDVKFVDVDGDGYITSGKGTFGDPGDRVVIGNSLPRYEYGMRIAFDYKSFDFSVIGQGVGKRAIWGDGQLAIPGYFAKEGAMPQAIAGDYWREDRTDAFYPRAWNLSGSNSGFVMRPQTKYLLNMAYFRIKNITLGYNVSPKLLDRVKLKQARVYVSMENFITFDNLRGLPIDPEAISGYSMLRGSNYNLGRTGTSNPTFKIASVGLNISL